MAPTVWWPSGPQAPAVRATRRTPRNTAIRTRIYNPPRLPEVPFMSRRYSFILLIALACATPALAEDADTTAPAAKKPNPSGTYDDGIVIWQTPMDATFP